MPPSALLSPSISLHLLLPPSRFSQRHNTRNSLFAPLPSPLPLKLHSALIPPPLRSNSSILLSKKLQATPHDTQPTTNNQEKQEDYVAKVIKDNPSQLEPKLRIRDRLLTLRELKNPPRLLQDSTKNENEDNSNKHVHLKDILKDFRGKLYVPEHVFNQHLSEEEQFEKELEQLPVMSADEFEKHVKTGKVAMLTSRSKVGLTGYRDFIVELKDVPGDKSVHKRKWAVRLHRKRTKEVLGEYKGPQYEIETPRTSYVWKLPKYPHPVADSVSSRILAEFLMLAVLIAGAAAGAAAALAGFMATAAFAATSFVYAATIYVVWPLAIPILKLALGFVSDFAEGLTDFFIDISEGDLMSKIKTYYTYGGISNSIWMSLSIISTVMMMIFVIRYTLSRRPKNFKKWNIWQGIEFSQSKAHARVDGETGVRFSDVAGIDEAVAELQELVTYLKNPELFDKMSIKPPHGVLLEGPPGCGKTLVAKAVAGEAGVPFYQMAGSEFVEVLVGVGSARIRDLFKRAKVNKPSVVFVDEIDALGTRRQGITEKSAKYVYDAGTQERETTLNQLLVELDGFDTGKGVIFLAATNRMDLLDPALLRPGRFDRKIRIRPPGAKGRLDILKVHARNVKLAPSVDLSRYALNLTGWTGAKLAQLLQESALVAVRNRHEAILQSDIDDAADRLTVGPKLVGIELGHQGQCRRAVAGVGLAVTSHLLRRYEDAKVEPCERISITPRGKTLSQIIFTRLCDESYEFSRRPQLLHRLQVLLGARAAEEVIYGRDTSKVSLEYLTDASWLARKILRIWNLENPMTIHGEPPPWRREFEFIGPRLDFEGSLYDDYGLIEPPLNFDLDDRVAQRTEELMHDMYVRTVTLLRKHFAALLKTVKVLLNNKAISGDQIEFIISNYPAEMPLELVLEEKDPGSLPQFELDHNHEMVLTSLVPVKETAE